MNTLKDARKVRLPDQVLMDTGKFLRARGTMGFEAFVLWAGRCSGTVCDVLSTVIPAQEGLRLDSGLLVQIDGKELHRLNVWLFEQKLEWIAQVHSHPGEAYHSETDDAFPIATREGAFSIVVPNFAHGETELTQCAVFRLSEARWAELSAQEIAEIFEVI